MFSKPFRIIFAYARNYWLTLTVAAVSMLLLVGVQLLVPWVIRLLINAVTTTPIAVGTRASSGPSHS